MIEKSPTKDINYLIITELRLYLIEKNLPQIIIQSQSIIISKNITKQQFKIIINIINCS